jgi:putative membrane protein
VAESAPSRLDGRSAGETSTELSARRTGMSFQRTRLSAERTLMSVLRTSLSLISFGFTIYQFFGHLQREQVLTRAHAPRNFGLALIYVGVGMLVVGIVFHVRFMRGLRRLRDEMEEEKLIHAESAFPGSYTLVVAVLLLIVGLAAIASVSFNFGPLE